jgi:hypothetical protein
MNTSSIARIIQTPKGVNPIDMPVFVLFIRYIGNQPKNMNLN